jgi:hypothetical protein
MRCEPVCGGSMPKTLSLSKPEDYGKDYNEKEEKLAHNAQLIIDFMKLKAKPKDYKAAMKKADSMLKETKSRLKDIEKTLKGKSKMNIGRL